MSYDKRFTNRVTQSVLQIRSPHFYSRPSPAQAVQKRSGYVFPSTDRVTLLVNRQYCLDANWKTYGCAQQGIRYLRYFDVHGRVE